MQNSKRFLAIQNNANWCARIWHSHGLNYVQEEGLIYCAGNVPDFYPNVITIDTGDKKQEQQISDIRDGKGELPFSVKDSFANLSLKNYNFRALFDGTWLYLSHTTPLPPSASLHWLSVRYVDQLKQWEQHWDCREIKSNPIFMPDLLNDPDIQFWYALSEGKIVSSFISNRTGAVVGLSNIVGSFKDCTCHARKQFPDLDLVGYESLDVVREAEALGFEAVGTLTVWLSI